MAYKEYHDIPFNSKIEEAIIGSFSGGQLLWVAPALVLSVTLAKYTPLLPFESFLFARIHWALPLVLALIFIKVKHPKTNLTLSKYLVLMVKFKFKRKKFKYQRENITKFYREKEVVKVEGKER